MRKAFLLAITITALAACSKDETSTIPCCEPPFPKLISQDTITQGKFWDFNIGESAETIYQKIQNSGPIPEIGYMAVISNIFNRVEDIQSILPLYKTIVLHEMLQGGKVIQIAFADNKVSSIYSNDGQSFNTWPSPFAGKSSITKGDGIGEIYEKLLAISQQDAHKKLFEHIVISTKDIAKDYEPGMGTKILWQLVATEPGNYRWHVDLNFQSGKLASVYAQLVQD